MSNIPQPRLIPNVISDRAKNAPDSIWASIPLSQNDASKGYEDITYARLNYAISRASRWLQDTVRAGTNLPGCQALAYIGPPDTRYIILTVAAIKAGYQMLFLSPRNSEEAQESVITQAGCSIFLSSRVWQTRVQNLLESRPRLSGIAHYVVPEQEDLLKDESTPEFPYNRTVEEARYDPLVILHTSSTTGIPKTIPLNQGYGFYEDAIQHVPNSEGLDIIARKPFYGHCRMFVAMPLYHAGGVLVTLLKSLYHNIVTVFQPASIALSADLFDAILRHAHCTGCVIPPYLLEEMLSDPDQFDTLARLDFVQFGSGPLSRSAGDKLLTRQKNCPHYIGSSEWGLYILLELDDPVEDWQYFRFHPWSGVTMRPIDDKNQSFEMVIVKSDECIVPGIQPVFELFPELKEWNTQDLYSRHPTKPDHWRCIGRNDDVLVLSNGEKLNPVDTEARIAGAHPAVTGVVVIGHGQFVPGLLLEVRGLDISSASEKSKLIEEIWPAIQRANQDAPGHGRLDRELILLASADKPFLRTPKLSLRRKATVDLYAEEITQMYEAYMASRQGENDANGAVVLDLGSQSDVQVGLSQLVCSENGWRQPPGDEEDLFMLGMDSLNVLRLSRTIKASLSKHGRAGEFDARMLYRNPTLKSLSGVIFKMAQAAASSAPSSQPIQSTEGKIEALIEKYSDFGASPHTASIARDHDTGTDARELNIILTGTTGSLGSYLLLALLEMPNVRKVYCLNRAEDAESRQAILFEQQGVDACQLKAYKQRLHFLYTRSLAGPLLGLSDSKSYELLKESRITHIIHNAWPVNFNIGLSSFESHVAGVRSLIDFSAAFPEMPKILFVSSLSSVNTLASRETVPETTITTAAAASPMGYGQSKYAAEVLLSKATEWSRGKLATAILRLGQIAGPVLKSTGTWPEREWLPSLVTSSRTVQALPTTLGRMETVDWMPVDLLAQGICDLLENRDTWDLGRASPDKASSCVFHVVNPSRTTWAELGQFLKSAIDISKMVTLEDWIELVRRGPDVDDKEHRNPAKKILPYYESLAIGETVAGNDRVRYATGNMARCSETFRRMPPISGDMLVRWAKQWT